ncbi:MAG TPA: hypothetical protein VKT77_18670 [Chthonomonadaceae bacterium]|nr:hypothetical protein [Chthonomonadaceae bacterium]
MSSGVKQAIAAGLFLLVAAGAFAAQGDKSKPAAHSHFDQFKALAGDWVRQDTTGGSPTDLVVNFRVIAAQSAVVETELPGTDHEMVTIITRDGEDLSLTHYCAMGNQPHMKVADKGAGNVVAFKFTGGGNMKSDKEAHMHSVTYTFVDKDTLKAEWSLYANGKPSGSMVFTLKRK